MPAADVFVLGFGTNEKLSSRLIRRATHGWCSHVWVEYSSLSFGGMWVVHAQDDGIVKERISTVWSKYPTFRRMELVNVPQETVREAIKASLDRLGRPYDYGIILNGMKLWWYLKTGHVSRPRRDPYLLHCSEFVSLVLRDIRLENWEQLDAEVIYPTKLWNFCYGHPNFKYI